MYVEHGFCSWQYILPWAQAFGIAAGVVSIMQIRHRRRCRFHGHTMAHITMIISVQVIMAMYVEHGFCSWQYILPWAQAFGMAAGVVSITQIRHRRRCRFHLRIRHRRRCRVHLQLCRSAIYDIMCGTMIVFHTAPHHYPSYCGAQLTSLAMLEVSRAPTMRYKRHRCMRKTCSLTL